LSGALRWNFTRVETCCDQRDRDVLAPTRGSFNTDLFNTMGGQQLDRQDEPGTGVIERVGHDPDTVAVNDAERECCLVRVDSRDG
jgi:hypothetical protein